MSDENEPKGREDKIGGIPIRSEEIGFSPDQMAKCAKCAKANPPNRLQCMYCGADLDGASTRSGDLRINLRPLEEWENGYNLVTEPGDASAADLRQAAAALGVETAVLEAMLNSGKRLPIARVESPRIAEALSEKLRAAGIATTTIADEELALRNEPVRLRCVEFGEAELTLTTFNSRETIRIPRHDITLIVTGTVVDSKTDTTEKRKRKDTKVLDETATSDDEVVIDIYPRGDGRGYRVFSDGFDFSGLGADKDLLAARNIKKLLACLKEAASEANFVDDFDDVEALLGPVWPQEVRRESHGMQRTGFGKVDFARTERVSNLVQFTRYSRLCRQFV